MTTDATPAGARPEVETDQTGAPFQTSPAPTTNEGPPVETVTPRSVRILVIDDEIRLQELLVEALRGQGHTVWGATNGLEGLAILDREAIDVVFTDLAMPEVSGWDVARAVKKKDPRVPVVLVTGLRERGPHRLRENGVDFVLAKPFRMEELFSALIRALVLRTDCGKSSRSGRQLLLTHAEPEEE